MPRLLKFTVAGLLALSVLALLLTAAGCGSPVSAEAVSAASPSPRPDSIQPPAWLLDAVRQQATSCGDPHPELVMWTTCRRSDAVRVLMGGGVPDGDRVYGVVLKGQFVNTKSFGPTGGDVKGTWMTLTFDARTHIVDDYGLGDVQPGPMRELGPVHAFSL
jgi:hypothetical protein